MLGASAVALHGEDDSAASGRVAPEPGSGRVDRSVPVWWDALVSRLIPALLLLSAVAIGCRRDATPALRGVAPPEPELVGPPEPDARARPRWRKPPAPLLPSWQRVGRARSQDIAPCAVLANRVCGILSEGAEECIVARDRVRRQPRSLEGTRCQAALTWFRENVEEARHPDPCSLLRAKKCARLGPEHAECKDLKRLLPRSDKDLKRRVCEAELLLIDGLARREPRPAR